MIPNHRESIMNELKSLPESLSQQIRAIASGLPETTIFGGGGRGSFRPDPMAIERHAAIEIARKFPELVASVILTHMGVVGVELIEVEEHREDRLVEHRTPHHHHTEIEPFVTRKTMKRSIRLFSKDGSTTGEQA